MFVAFPLPDGSYFQVRHLPWAVVDELEAKYDTSWAVITDMPQVNGRILIELANAVAIVNGYEAPVIETVEDLALISASLRLVDAEGVPIAVEEDASAISWSAE